jgi:hypothetical protein
LQSFGKLPIASRSILRERLLQNLVRHMQVAGLVLNRFNHSFILCPDVSTLTG